jgi:hypothetical protein
MIQIASIIHRTDYWRRGALSKNLVWAVGVSELARFVRKKDRLTTSAFWELSY